MVASLSSFLTSYTQFELPQNEAKPGNNQHLRGVEPLFPVFSPGLSTSSVSNWTHQALASQPSGMRPPCLWRLPKTEGWPVSPSSVPGLDSAQMIHGGQPWGRTGRAAGARLPPGGPLWKGFPGSGFRLQAAGGDRLACIGQAVEAGKCPRSNRLNIVVPVSTARVRQPSSSGQNAVLTAWAARCHFAEPGSKW
jgi:hypothetical protein